MADIIDIVHRLSYELQGQGLNEAAAALGNQVKQLGQLRAEQQQLAKEQQQAANAEQRVQDAITDAINKNREQQKQLNKQIQDNVAINKTLLTSLNTQANTIDKIDKQIKTLQATQKKATTENIAGINQQIQALQKQKDAMLSQGVSGSFFNSLLGISPNGGGIGRQILTGSLIGLGIGGGFGLITRAVSALAEELGNVGNEILNTDSYQEKLRESTERLVSEIQKEISELNNLDPALQAYKDQAVELNNQIGLLKTIGAIDLQIYDNKKKINDLQKEATQNTLNQSNEEVKNAQDIINALYAARNLVKTNGVGTPNTTNIGPLRLDSPGNLQQIKELFDKLSGSNALLKESLDKIYLELTKSGASNFFSDALTKQIETVISRASGQVLRPAENKATQAQGARNEAELQLIRERQQEVDKLNDELANREKQGEIKVEQAQIQTEQNRLKNTEAYYEADNLIRRGANLNIQNIELDKQAKLLAIDKEEEDKKRELVESGGQLDASLTARYAGLRAQAEAEATQAIIRERENLNRRLIDFHTEQIKLEDQNNTDIINSKLKNAQEQYNIDKKNNENTFADLQALTQAEYAKELNDIYEKYNKQIEANKKIGVDVTSLVAQYYDDLDLLRLKFQRTELQRIEQAYNDQLSVIKVELDRTFSTIDSIYNKQDIELQKKYFSGGIGLGRLSLRQAENDLQVRRERARAAAESANNQKSAADENLGRVLNNPNSSSNDVSVAIAEQQQAIKIQKQTGDELVSIDQFVLNKRLENLQIYLSATQQVQQAIQQGIEVTLQRQEQALDTEISIRQKRVDIALKLAERGNTDAVKLEEQYLEQAYKKKEEIARKEQALNAATALSNALVAVTGAIANATGGDPYTLVAREVAAVAAIAAALVSGYALVASLKDTSSSGSTGFFKGGYTGEGNPHDEAGVVHKGEFVMPHKITANPENRAFLEAMYKGYSPWQFAQPAITGSFASRSDMKETNKRLDALIDRTRPTALYVNYDKRGIFTSIEEEGIKDKKRWKA